LGVVVVVVVELASMQPPFSPKKEGPVDYPSNFLKNLKIINHRRLV